MKPHLLVWLAFVSTFAVGQTARAEGVGSLREKVVNGSPTEPGGRRGTVALLFAPDASAPEELSPRTLWGRLRCSAVLIAPDVAVTAAHCVDVCGFEPCPFDEDGTSSCYVCEREPLPASSLYVAAGVRTLDDVWSAEVLAVRELIVHEDYRPPDQWVLDVGECESSDEGFVCENPGFSTDVHDIALLLLEDAVTVQNPVRLLPESDEPVGVLGTAQGYGGRARPDDEGLLDQQDYTSLLNETRTAIEQVTEQELLTAQGADRSGICFGDSGGPLYVPRGGESFAAGVASRFRLDSDEPVCADGAIYTSLAGYTDWIHENAPETIPVQLGAVGGAPPSWTPAVPSGVGLVAMLAMLLVVRARRLAFAVAAVTVLGALATGCGSDAEGGASLCNETYDPTGGSCDPAFERIDLRTAEQRARRSMPSDAWLWSAVGGAEGTVNPDGEAVAWFLRYFIPGESELPDAVFRSVTVFASGDLRPFRELGALWCTPTEPMIPLDSRRIVHDAIGRFERAGIAVRIGETGLLRVFQSHRCSRAPDEWGGVSFGNSFLYYDDVGTYLGAE